MVENTLQKRPPGRPRSFDRAEALDRAVAMFWADGYEGVDVERIARAVGVTKPSLYRVFGDKASLYVKAVQRYAETYGAGAVTAFVDEPDIGKAVLAFSEAAVRAATTPDGRQGCLMACAVTGRSERVDELRDFFATGMTRVVDLLAARFAVEIAAGRLSDAFPAKARARLLVDAMQGMGLRARAGVSRDALLKQLRGYAPIVLG